MRNARREAPRNASARLTPQRLLVERRQTVPRKKTLDEKRREAIQRVRQAPPTAIPRKTTLDEKRFGAFDAPTLARRATTVQRKTTLDEKRCETIRRVRRPLTLARRAPPTVQRKTQRGTARRLKRLLAGQRRRFSAKKRSTRSAAKRFGAFDAPNACSPSDDGGSAQNNARREAPETIRRVRRPQRLFAEPSPTARRNAKKRSARERRAF